MCIMLSLIYLIFKKKKKMYTKNYYYIVMFVYLFVLYCYLLIIDFIKIQCQIDILHTNCFNSKKLQFFPPNVNIKLKYLNLFYIKTQ